VRVAVKKLTKIQKWSLEEARRVVFQVLGNTPADVYLYGSFARGEVYPSSDLDIAIMPRGKRRATLAFEIEEALEESTIPYRAQVVDLSRADAAFRERVLKEGIKWSA